MFNKAKYLTAKIAGILSIIMGGAALFLTLLTFTTDCANCVELFTVFYIFATVIRVCVCTLLISNGLKCLSEPVQDLASSSTRHETRLYWTYVPKNVSLTLIVLAGVYALVSLLSIFVPVVGGVTSGTIGNFSLIVEIVSTVAFLAIVALQIVNINLKDNRVFDENGNLVE